MPSDYSKALAGSREPYKYELDKRFYDTIYAEVGGGSPEEVAAVASVFLNRVRDEGYSSALMGSSAYRKGSPEYKKAKFGKLNRYESSVYRRNKAIVDSLVANQGEISPFYYFENVEAFGEPSWASSVGAYTDIGRQRFYLRGE